MSGGVGGVYVLIFDVVVELRAGAPKAKTLDARLTDCGRGGRGDRGRDGGGCGRDGGETVGVAVGETVGVAVGDCEHGDGDWFCRGDAQSPLRTGSGVQRL